MHAALANKLNGKLLSRELSANEIRVQFALVEYNLQTKAVQMFHSSYMYLSKLVFCTLIVLLFLWLCLCLCYNVSFFGCYGYCKSGIFCENFIFTNRVKRHTCICDARKLWLGHDLPISVNDRVISHFSISQGFYFSRNFAYAKFHENKPSRKFLNLQ